MIIPMLTLYLVDHLYIILAVPKGLSFIEVRDDLYAVKGVKQIHSLYIWSITSGRAALASHLAIGRSKSVRLGWRINIP